MRSTFYNKFIRTGSYSIPLDKLRSLNSERVECTCLHNSDEIDWPALVDTILDNDDVFLIFFSFSFGLIV